MQYINALPIFIVSGIWNISMIVAIVILTHKNTRYAKNLGKQGHRIATFHKLVWRFWQEGQNFPNNLLCLFLIYILKIAFKAKIWLHVVKIFNFAPFYQNLVYPYIHQNHVTINRILTKSSVDFYRIWIMTFITLAYLLRIAEYIYYIA